jgi:hypothetical protein
LDTAKKAPRGIKNLTTIRGKVRRDMEGLILPAKAGRLLKESDEISPVAILMKIGNLSQRDYEAWLHGRIPYLERAFQGSLSKANRYLRIIGFHAHDLDMVPIGHTYSQIGKKRVLRFSRSHDPNVEKSYGRHFRWNRSQSKKLELIERI